MNFASEKLEIIQWIASLDDKTILKELKKLKELTKSSNIDWWDTISPEEQVSIERGINDSQNGRTTPHSKVKQRYEKHL